jgi:diacylglycerol kinase (ATP)
MTHFHLFESDPPRPRPKGPADPAAGVATGMAEPPALAAVPVPAAEAFLTAEEEIWEEPQPGRRIGEKLSGGLTGLRKAIRGDSSFFAHGYRGLLIALTAGILGVGPLGWCLLIVSAALVLGSELFHSALDRLSRSPLLAGDRDVQAARDIAAGAVVVASLMSAALTLTVLISRLGAQLGW